MSPITLWLVISFVHVFPQTVNALARSVGHSAAREVPKIAASTDTGCLIQQNWHEVENSPLLSEAMPLLSRSCCDFRQRFGNNALKQNVSLYFVGDSTVRNLFSALCVALGAQVFRVNLTEVTERAMYCAGSLGSAQVFATYGEALCWRPELLDGLVSYFSYGIGHPSPTAVYTTSGLWLQWPVPSMASEEWATFGCWSGYDRILDTLLDSYSKFSPLTVVATPHSECDKTFTGDWKHADKEACAEYLQNETLSREQALSFCEQGRRGRKASALLSDRLKDDLQKMDEEARVGPSIDIKTMDVALVDLFAITDGRCDMNYGADSVHYVFLVYDELATILKAIGWQAAFDVPTNACLMPASPYEEKRDSYTYTSPAALQHDVHYKRIVQEHYDPETYGVNEQHDPEQDDPETYVDHAWIDSY